MLGNWNSPRVGTWTKTTQIETMLKQYGLSNFVKDIDISNSGVVDHNSFGLKKLVSVMNYWDPLRVKDSLSEKEENSTTTTFMERGDVVTTLTDPRLLKDSFCVQYNREDEEVSLDLYCDNDRIIHFPKNEGVNEVFFLSFIILLVENLNTAEFVTLQLEEKFVRAALLKIKNNIINDTENARQLTDWWEKMKKKIDTKFISEICKKQSHKQQFFELLQKEVKNGNKQKVLTFLYEMKKTGDWGQASWVHRVNQTRHKNKILFVSGDRLASLYSILIGNYTLFGGAGLGGTQMATLEEKREPKMWTNRTQSNGTIWGLYLPSQPSMKGRGDKPSHFCKNKKYKELLMTLFSIDFSAIYNELTGKDINITNEEWYERFTNLSDSNISIEEYLIYDFIVYTVPALYLYIAKYEKHNNCVSLDQDGWIGVMKEKLGKPSQLQYSKNEKKLLQIGIQNNWIN